MAKKAGKTSKQDQFEFTMIAIVAIIGIVALVFIHMGKGMTAAPAAAESGVYEDDGEERDMAGQAVFCGAVLAQVGAREKRIATKNVEITELEAKLAKTSNRNIKARIEDSIRRAKNVVETLEGEVRSYEVNNPHCFT